MRTLYTLLFFLGSFLFILSVSSCRDDFESTPSTGNLEFSRDTVYLDTVFANVGSSTYRLKVYNRSNNLINIPSLGLARGEQSQYRLNVDGIAGKVFNNVEILARDSIFIFIETTIDYSSLEADSSAFLYTDQINFDTGMNEQNVPLISLVQDAVFLFPQRDEAGMEEQLNLGTNSAGEEISLSGFYLQEDELRFTNEKPYVIYGYAGVGAGQTLNIEAGARIHFHEDSGIIVQENASLHVDGTLSQDSIIMENEVIFEGDRLEPLYENIPGQWGTIWLAAGSTNNRMNHATIKNATVGLRVIGSQDITDSTLHISNTQIYNSATTGLLAQGARITGENLVINNSGFSSMQLSQGGNYVFKHATIVNYWQNSFRQAAALQIENFADESARNLVQARFENCIITGNRTRELEFFASNDAAFNFSFINSLIQVGNFSNPGEEDYYDFENTSLYNGVILNGDPDFRNPTANDLRIGEDSDARATALPLTAQEVPLDLLGVPRGAEPDMGAYESIRFNED